MPETVAILAAAGSGCRLAVGAPKAFVDLDGRTVLEHAVAGLHRSEAIDHVVVAAPAQRLPEARRLLGPGVTVVAGGADRRDSVTAALAAVPDVDFILVHDAARPLTPSTLIARVVQSLRAGQAAVVPAVQPADTVKAVAADGTVLATPARSGLRLAQTPQGFRADLLRRAYRSGGADGTDDATLVERIGARVQTIAGDPLAFKITTAADLLLARAVLRR